MKILAPEVRSRRPKAVLFDLDDTLYDYHWSHSQAMNAVRDKVNRTLRIPTDLFDTTFGQARDEVKKALGPTASSHNRLLYFHRLVELLDLKSQPAIALDLEATYWRTFLMNARLFGGVEDFLIELRATGLPLALVTDLTAQIQFRKIVYFGIDRYFDFVVTSEEAGTDKTGLRPFHAAVAKLRLAPDDPVWFIGDDECDVVASKKVLNAATFQKVPEHGAARPVHDGADVVFKSFEALLDWTRGIFAADGPMKRRTDRRAESPPEVT